MSDTEGPGPREIIGGNHPPITDTLREQLPILADSLAWKFADLEVQMSNALTQARELPAVVNSNDIMLQCATVVKALKAVGKVAEAQRTNEKRPYRDAGDIVDGYFKTSFEAKIEKTLTIIDKRVKPFQDAETARKKREAEEQARLAREQEQARLAAAAKLEADAKKLRDEEDKKRRELLASQTAAPPPDFSQAPAPSQSSALTNFAAEHVDHANLHAHDARVADKVATAKPADLVRARGADGAMATVTEFWTHSVYALEEIPPAMLWPFISDQAKQVAVTAFVKAGNRELPGVRIYQDTKPTYR